MLEILVHMIIPGILAVVAGVILSIIGIKLSED